jgi:hypothetical protein
MKSIGWEGKQAGTRVLGLRALVPAQEKGQANETPEHKHKPKPKDRSKLLLLSSFSHELRTSLNGVRLP